MPHVKTYKQLFSKRSKKTLKFLNIFYDGILQRILRSGNAVRALSTKSVCVYQRYNLHLLQTPKAAIKHKLRHRKRTSVSILMVYECVLFEMSNRTVLCFQTDCVKTFAAFLSCIKEVSGFCFLINTIGFRLILNKAQSEFQ